jgi:P27 family predicted phage terminase small subunit
VAIRGPKPTPIELRKQDGSYRPDRHGTPNNLGNVPDDFMEPPDSLDETAKQMWRQAVPTLQRVGLLSVVDTAALEMLCTQYARAKQAARIIAEQGHLARGSTGQLTEHPAIRTEREAAMAFLRFAEQYALTPVARTRLGLAEMQRQTLAQDVESILGEPEFEPVP